MDKFSTSLIYAQRDSSAYQAGRKVGQIVGIIFIVVIVIVVLKKILGK